MKLTELITKLQEDLTEHGDVEIYAPNIHGNLQPIDGTDWSVGMRGNSFFEKLHITTE